jgi:hypothetical protein
MKEETMKGMGDEEEDISSYSITIRKIYYTGD